MTKKGFLIIFLFISTTTAIAQKMGIEYVTALDSTEVNHYLTFSKNETMTIYYPVGRGVFWNAIIEKPKSFTYSVHNDTMEINMTSVTSTSPINSTERRILNSKFVVTSKNQLYDVKSGYFYIDRRQSNKFKNGVVVFDNNIYIIKKRGNRALRKKLKEINIDDYKTTILRGKSALDKYGVWGINGVLVVEKK
ncbi:hypothetical protein [Prolixibacter denitrificans]|uniref:Uncharacterized protein n=1 Tax=Prolixibacter denitrificans TaxID=1541063 RepID=A0A2P8C8F7_9BACT|nr:hypothetical protein [Prolixibacter denitrificans]PSK81246.1 hypothetical protein CLV93_11030 [Prolixibacter denitrificans]GET21670.1 hypothetical protein JCM18694_19160 [Prolixibacter denitrificans]